LPDYAKEFDQFLQRLFPICRSITGEGNRETLRILNEIVPIVQHEVSSGTQVYDWVIPEEWNIRNAWIATHDGRRIIDFKSNNLHVMSYSEPIEASMKWAELKSHLYTHPELPEAIPYRTTYYKRDWGFCVTQSQYEELERLEEPFQIMIDSELKPGSLTYGECLISGRSSQEILISCYICHPSMANDCLSGVLLTAFLARHLKKVKNRFWSYRIVFVPETLGAITYCAVNEETMKKIDMGLVITTVGGPGKLGYKKSWQLDHSINRIIEEVMNEAGESFITYPFDIHGSDERQYSSQGFRINCATICKDRYYEYPEYHSSLDNLDFVTGEQIAFTFALYLKVIDKIENRKIFKSRIPYGEVMLSRHGLYPSSGGAQCPDAQGRSELDLILWILFLCDGRKSLNDIALELSVDESSILPVVERLVQKGVLGNV
jgi:aminopeptidase-like protein